MRANGGYIKKIGTIIQFLYFVIIIIIVVVAVVIVTWHDHSQYGVLKENRKKKIQEIVGVEK